MSDSGKNKIPAQLVVAIYGHPEAYPPTLNALTELSKIFENITVIFRPLFPLDWAYAPNVVMRPSGKSMTVRQQEQLPLPKRLLLFAGFVIDFLKLCLREKPSVILLYDPLALMVYRLVRKLGIGRHQVWYHNHDVLEANQKPFSLNWLACRMEKKIFPHLDIFTLPSNERKAYFPMENFRGKYFFLPNQPAISFYGKFQNTANEYDIFRIIFQGHIDAGHGIEEIMDIMPAKVNGKTIHLVLKGWIRDQYKAILAQLIEKKGLQNHVKLVGYTAYQELPKLTASCHVGIAIHTKADIMNKTLGTASNKIYEYAALGLPVLYYDNRHFKKHLGKYSWAFATDLSADSLRKSFEHICVHHAELSQAARREFMSGLNYEHYFQPLGEHLNGLTNQA
jgi:glycosyltransferase involved in cell wall biosynthesis